MNTRSIQTTARITPRARRACAAFGLRLEPTLDPDPNPPPHTTPDTLQHLRALPPGRAALITGPSGSGKTTLLRALAKELHTHTVIQPDEPPLAREHHRAVIDHLPGRTRDAQRTLAAAGLAEPALYALPPAALSAGQRRRLAIAIAIHRATTARPAPGNNTWLLADELTSGLDAPTAHALAATLCAWAARTRTRLVAADTDDALATPLRASLTIRLTLDNRADITPTDRPTDRPADTPSNPDPTRIEPGNIADYDRLARFHYRAPRPATHTRILRARDDAGETIGALVVSMPTLNAAWRDVAWPGRFTARSRRENARRLNRDLRCISRVVVDPRHRARGIARRLVRTYLDNPDTPATEAVAALGAACPFFERAGMTPYHLPPPPADARLLDALRANGLTAASLLHPGAAARAAEHPFLAIELHRWAGAGRATRHLLGEPPAKLAEHAALRLLTTRTAYAHSAAP